MKKRVWVTGAAGLIGNYVVEQAMQFTSTIEAIPLTRNDVDLRDRARLEALFLDHAPDGIIHCAAIANTGTCESDQQLATAVNVSATKSIARLGAELPLVFLSTDIVFDGLKGDYSENDRRAPINVYGQTKQAAEEIVLANPKHSVVRLSLNGGKSPSGDRGFNEVLYRSLSKGNVVRLFDDEFRQPLPAVVTSKVLWEVFLNQWSGVFHLGGAEKMSRYEIGRLLVRRWGDSDLEARLEPSSLKGFMGGKRAPDTSMNCDRLQSRLSFQIPSLRDWLDQNPDAPF